MHPAPSTDASILVLLLAGRITFVGRRAAGITSITLRLLAVNKTQAFARQMRLSLPSRSENDYA